MEKADLGIGRLAHTYFDRYTNPYVSIFSDAYFMAHFRHNIERNVLGNADIFDHKLCSFGADLLVAPGTQNTDVIQAVFNDTCAVLHMVISLRYYTA